MRRTVARRTLVRRRAVAGARPGSSARPIAMGRRPQLPRRKTRDAQWGAAVLALAVLAWLLWPASPPPAKADPPPAPAVRAAKDPVPRAIHKAAARRPPPAAAPAPPGVDEARLRAAVLARAGDLRKCPVPAGAPSQIPVRLRVPASGEVRSLQLGGGDPLPSELSACLREKLLLWRFDDLHLESDVELFATFALR